VGDIIRVKKDHYFPCDAILLDHHRAQTTAFVETKNLDGETNLKLKKTCDNLDFLRELSEYDLYSLQVEFAFEKPNPFLSTFNGNVTIRNVSFLPSRKNIQSITQMLYSEDAP
jgi:magnesium-transporting ATPase (P-type)